MPGTGANPEMEWSLLRAACAPDSRENSQLLRALLASTIRWKELLDLAEHHRVQCLLYQALLRAGGMVPAREMEILRLVYTRNVHKSLFLSRELIRIVDCLASKGMNVLPYKGVALAEAVYGDMALRQAGDIDLLIRPADLAGIREALQEIGYTPHATLSFAEEHSYLRSGYECVFDGAAGRNLLEVQWAIQPRFYAVDYVMDGLFERSVPSCVAGREMRTLSSEDLFMVLALHAAKHVWGRLIWVCDLARIIDWHSLNWNWIGMQAAGMGIVRILRVSLLLLQRLLGTTIPGAAEDALPKDAVAAELSEEIQQYISHNPEFDVESLDYFRLMLRLRERQRDRLRFLSRLALTPGPGEWAAIRLPRVLFPLYRVVRITRVAARIVGA